MPCSCCTRPLPQSCEKAPTSLYTVVIITTPPAVHSHGWSTPYSPHQTLNAPLHSTLSLGRIQHRTSSTMACYNITIAYHECTRTLGPRVPQQQPRSSSDWVAIPPKRFAQTMTFLMVRSKKQYCRHSCTIQGNDR